VLRADRLTERKNYWALIESMSVVMQMHDDIDLIIHCLPIDDGLNLHKEIGHMPEALRKRVILTGAHDTWVGLSEPGLAILYNAADLYVSPTAGEGFGLTLAESIACGTPVVTTDYAAGPEVVGPGGWLVPVLKDHRGNDVRQVSRYGMDWRQPDVEAFTSTILIALAASDAQKEQMALDGREHIMKSFNWSATAKAMLRHMEHGIKEWHGSHSNGSGSQDLSANPTDHLGSRLLADAAHPSSSLDVK
jgi:glycosyltransferase involved in cell wall biosynthesis